MIRPFYIEADIEGRQTNLTGGTSRKDGSQTIHIYQREDGCITKPIRIEQYSMYDEDGTHILITDVYLKGERIAKHITNY